jgi:hypothetical protein
MDVMFEYADGIVSSADAKSASVDWSFAYTNVCTLGAYVCTAGTDGNESGTENTKRA